MKRMTFERWQEIQARHADLLFQMPFQDGIRDFVVSGNQATADLGDCIEEIKALNTVRDRQAERISRLVMRLSIAGTQTDDPATRKYLLETLDIVNREGHFA